MLDTSARLLRLLSLLATGRSWTSPELAGRLEITERTVRRDITRLRDLGYGIESQMGPWGGYRLGPGAAVPPLILDDEEALAVAVGLRAAALGAVSGSDQAALSALLKLRQWLPSRIADRLGSLDTALTHIARPDDGQTSPALLLDLATACRRGERVQMTYRDASGATSHRRIDPYRLVSTGRRWYLVAHDLTRQDWRTFRTDRILDATAIGQPVDLPDPPDPARLVSRGLAVNPYAMHVTIRLPMPAEEALRVVPATTGFHRPDGEDATLIDIGGPTADDLAGYLLGLGVPLRILAPEDVRQAFLTRVQRLLDENRLPVSEGQPGERGAARRRASAAANRAGSTSAGGRPKNSLDRW